MKKFLAPIVGAALIAGATGCTVISTEPNERAVQYDAGIFSSTQFENCVNPGVREWNGPGDVSKIYPAGQRNYQFLANGGDMGAIEVLTKNQATVTIEGVISFELTGDCDKLREFHERVGAQHGWDQLLTIYMAQPIKDLITEATLNFTWEELTRDELKRQEWSKMVTERLNPRINHTINGDYFKVLSVTLQKPTLNPELKASLDRAQIATQDAITQEQANTRIRTEMDGIRDQIAVLGVDGYLKSEAIKKGNIPFIPVPEGSPLVVQSN